MRLALFFYQTVVFSRAMACFLLSLCSLNGCLSVRGQDPAYPDRIGPIIQRLTQVRQLKLISGVPVLFASREGIKNQVEVHLTDDLGERNIDDVSLAYGKLGLLPWGVSFKSSLLNYYASRTSGFYDSRKKRIVLLGQEDRAIPILEETDEKVIVHELTHALQDQHFSLGARLRPLGNGDAALALRAVAEGDAVLTEHAYSFGRLDEGLGAYASQFLQSGKNASVLSDVPAVVREKVLFQYAAGVRFISRFLGKHGWVPINLIYEYPPLSTEQVLHVEKYFESPDPPTRINLRGLSNLFPQGWREIENDTLGELMIQCLFKGFLGAKAATAVANGWDGDRFVAYQRGKEVAFLWVTVWDSSSDAQEFFESYQEILSMKYDVRPSEKDRFYNRKAGPLGGSY
jgi:hypothetical protein